MTVKQHRIIQWITIALIIAGGVAWYYQVKVRGAQTVSNDNPSFQADLKSTLDLQAGVGGPTFTRATTATVTDFEGLIKKVKSGEARFEGARRVENLATFSEDFSNAVWTKNNTAYVVNSITAPNGTLTADTISDDGTAGLHRIYSNQSTIAGNVYIVSGYFKYGNQQWFALRGDTNSVFALFDVQNGVRGGVGAGVTSTLTNVGNGWYRFSMKYTATLNSLGSFIYFATQGTTFPDIYTGTGTYFYAWGVQTEDVTGQANQNPSEYVSTGVLTSAPYHGANVDGVKYFTTYNGNTVASNVVTEATGANIPDATLHGYTAEGARTNLALRSETFDNASWLKTGVTVTADNTNSPSGSQTADFIKENSALTAHYQVYAGISGTAGTTYTISTWAKMNGRRYAILGISDAITGNVYSYFDLQTCVITQAVAADSPWVAVDSTIRAGVNGWCYLTVTGTLGAGRTSANPVIFLSNSGTGSGGNSYTGDNVSGIYLWGAQLEAGSFASSYIPTTTASVTRNADSLTYPTAGNVDGTKGTAYAEVAPETTIPAETSPGYGNNYILDFNPSIALRHYNNYIRMTDNTNVTLSPVWNPIQNISYKIGSKWGGSSMGAVVNGVIGTSATFDGNMNYGANMFIGKHSTTGNYEWYGTIRNVKIWKKALSDGQLTNMTSTDADVSGSAVKATTIGSDGASFQADLKSTLDLQAGVGVPTFTRATVATVTDFEGLIKNVKSGEARFEGARRVENLVTFSEDFSNAIWTEYVAGSKASTSDVDPLGGNKALKVNNAVGTGAGIKQVTTTNLNGTYTISFWGKDDGTNHNFTFQVNEGIVQQSTIVTTSTWKRYSVTFTSTAGTAMNIGFRRAAASGYFYVAFPQIEDVTGQANQNPSEYVSTGVKTSAPYHGANVDGVKYFTTYNGNTTASNVVTEATGANIPDATLHGYVAEGARTNLALQSEAFDNASWTKTDVTTGTATTTSPRGDNTGSLSTEGSAGTANIIQSSTITAGATSTVSIFVKRGNFDWIRLRALAGSVNGAQAWFNINTGALGTTQNLGTGSFVAYSITPASNGFYRLTLTAVGNDASTLFYLQLMSAPSDGSTGRVANGTYYLWGAQLEAGSFASSYIPTTTASVTRNADVLTYPTAGNVDGTKGTAYAEVVATNSNHINLTVIDLGTNRPALYGMNTGTNLSIYDGTSESNILAWTKGISIQKMSSNWTGNIKKTSLNGTLSTNGSFDGNMDIGATLLLGGRGGSVNVDTPLYGTIRNVKIWKKALSDGQLTDLTSADADVSAGAVQKTIVNDSQNSKMTNGLVGFWSFNGPDMNGNSALDRSGNGNNGTLVGGVTKTIGKVVSALSFDGTSGYVDVPNSSSIGITGDMTISAWVKVTDFSNHNGIIGKTNNNQYANPYDFYFAQTTGVPRFYRGNGNSGVTNFSLGTNPPALNQWQFIAVTMSGTNVTHYLNGETNGTGTINTTTTNGSNSLYIGSRGDLVTKMKGAIDEVRIYNRALSATEVLSLYNLGR
jgi:3-methyladenine DNA glycosylase Tag